MKGIVVEIKGKYAVALSKEGGFVKIRNNGNLKMGYETDLNQPVSFNAGMLARVSSIAAAFLFTLGVGYSVYSYSTPYSYVGVDINPSIELTVNIYDRIIKTQALNSDGQKLLGSGNLQNKKLEAGVNELLDNAVHQGFLNTEKDNTVILTVTSKDEDKSSKLEKGLENTAAKELDKEKVDTRVVVEKSSVQKHEDAKKIGITSGKLSLIEKAMKAEPDLKMDDLKNAPVKDIMGHLKDNKKNNGKQNGKQKSNQESTAKNNGQSTSKSNKDNSQENQQEGNQPAGTANGSGAPGKTVKEARTGWDSSDNSSDENNKNNGSKDNNSKDNNCKNNNSKNDNSKNGNNSSGSYGKNKTTNENSKSSGNKSKSSKQKNKGRGTGNVKEDTTRNGSGNGSAKVNFKGNGRNSKSNDKNKNNRNSTNIKNKNSNQGNRN